MGGELSKYYTFGNLKSTIHKEKQVEEMRKDRAFVLR